MKVRCSGHFGHASPAGQEVATKNQKTKKAKHQEPKNKSQTKLKEGNSQPGLGFGFWILDFPLRALFEISDLRFEVFPLSPQPPDPSFVPFVNFVVDLPRPLTRINIYA
jgi:hypothetical protein